MIFSKSSKVELKKLFEIYPLGKKNIHYLDLELYQRLMQVHFDVPHLLILFLEI